MCRQEFRDSWISGLGFGVSVFRQESWISGLGFGASVFRQEFRDSRISGLGFGVSVFRVLGFGFGCSGSGFSLTSLGWAVPSMHCLEKSSGVMAPLLGGSRDFVGS